MWHGWHAFRRGLATNLHRLGVAGKEIQSILRHASLSTTMNIDVISVNAESVAAMKMLESLVCTNCAQQASSSSDVVVQWMSLPLRAGFLFFGINHFAPRPRFSFGSGCSNSAVIMRYSVRQKLSVYLIPLY